MARVRRFFLYGAYKSSSAVSVTAAWIWLSQFIGQFALLFDGGKDGSAALIEGTQADEFIGDDADLFVVQRAGHFLAVTGNEGDGVAFVQKVDDGGHLGGFDIQLGSNLFGVESCGRFYHEVGDIG